MLLERANMNVIGRVCLSVDAVTYRAPAQCRHACALDDCRPEVNASAASRAMRIAIGLGGATNVDAINHFSPRQGGRAAAELLG